MTARHRRCLDRPPRATTTNPAAPFRSAGRLSSAPGRIKVSAIITAAHASHRNASRRSCRLLSIQCTLVRRISRTGTLARLVMEFEKIPLRIRRHSQSTCRLPQQRRSHERDSPFEDVPNGAMVDGAVGVRQQILERDDGRHVGAANVAPFRRQATEALRRRSTTASTTRLNMSGFSTATWPEGCTINRSSLFV